jgi:hypothetical protein
MLLLILVFSLLITAVSYIKVWLQDTFGDSLAKDLGYLSFNPMLFIEYLPALLFIALGLEIVFGNTLQRGIFESIFVLVVIFSLGRTRAIPFNQDAITEPYKTLKLMLIFTIPSLLLLSIGIIAMIARILLISFVAFNETLALVYVMFFKSLISFSIYFAFLRFFYDYLELFFVLKREEGSPVAEYRDDVMMISMICMIVLIAFGFARPIGMFINYLNSFFLRILP